MKMLGGEYDLRHMLFLFWRKIDFLCMHNFVFPVCARCAIDTAQQLWQVPVYG